MPQPVARLQIDELSLTSQWYLSGLLLVMWPLCWRWTGGQEVGGISCPPLTTSARVSHTTACQYFLLVRQSPGLCWCFYFMLGFSHQIVTTRSQKTCKYKKLHFKILESFIKGASRASRGDYPVTFKQVAGALQWFHPSWGQNQHRTSDAISLCWRIPTDGCLWNPREKKTRVPQRSLGDPTTDAGSKLSRSEVWRLVKTNPFIHRCTACHSSLLFILLTVWCGNLRLSQTELAWRSAVLYKLHVYISEGRGTMDQ